MTGPQQQMLWTRPLLPVRAHSPQNSPLQMHRRKYPVICRVCPPRTLFPFHLEICAVCVYKNTCFLAALEMETYFLFLLFLVIFR